MKKFTKILLLIAFTVLNLSVFTPEVYAQDLSVTFEEDPLFDESDVKPCDIYTKTFTVTNLSTTDTYSFGIATFGEVDDDGLAGVMEVVITDQDDNVLYGGPADPKSLADLHDETEFSDDPATPGTEIFLLTVGPGETYTVSVTVTMPCELGNEWQLTETQFNLGVGWVGTVLGEEEEPPAVLGIPEVLGETGQNILLGLAVGGGLLAILIAGYLINKKNGNHKTKEA